MGCIWVLRCKTGHTGLNATIGKSFDSIRAITASDSSNLITVSTPNIYNNIKYKSVLSPHEFATYSRETYFIGFHRCATADLTMNGSQPFEDPKTYKMTHHPKIRSRPDRYLVCSGDIYNYQEVSMTHLDAEERDSSIISTSDVEILLPLFIKYGVEETMRIVDGDFSCVFLENLSSVYPTKRSVTVVTDKHGLHPLYRIKRPDDIAELIVSSQAMLPDVLNVPGVQVTVIPPGCIMTTSGITFWYTRIPESPKKIVYNSTSPDCLEILYKNIQTKIYDSVLKRIRNALITGIDVAVLVSGGICSSILLDTVMKILNDNHALNKVVAYTYCNEVKTDILVAYLERKYNRDIILHSIDDTEQNDNNHSIKLEEYMLKIDRYHPKVILSGAYLGELFCPGWIERSRTYAYGIRYPFIDTKLCDFASSIGDSLKTSQVIRANTRPVDKYILRKSFDHLPDIVLL